MAGEVSVKTFVAGDELVGECEAWHEASLLEPEYCAEAAAEEDALNAGKRHKALRKPAITAHGYEFVPG
jgi:hypothetical protein